MSQTDTLAAALPQDLEAERAALGAALLDAEARATVFAALTASDFHDPAHGQLFAFLVEMFTSLEPEEKPDAVTVEAALKAAGIYEQVGGREALVNFFDACPAPSAAEYYARIVKDKADLRRAMQAGLTLARQAVEPGANVATVFEAFDRKTRRCRMAAEDANATTTPVLVCLSDVAAIPVTWLWRPRIALGRMALLVGRPGEGKSFLALDLAARISTGTPFPDGSTCPVGSTILISVEDDPGDVIRPRLDAARADVNKVHLLRAVRHKGDGHEQMFCLRDLDALEAALKIHRDCRLIVVDPIGSFIGGSTDAHRDNEVRAVLAPAAALAEKYGPALLVIAHRRKSTADFADDLALGSRAFTGLARTVWHLTRDPENRARRLLLGGKNNLGPETDGLAFSITGDPPCLAWEREPVRMRADDALAAENEAGRKRGPEPKVRVEAESWITGFLAGGPRLADDCLAEAARVGIKEGTLRKAKAVLNIDTEKQGLAGRWTWKLPYGVSEQRPEGALVSPE